MERARTIDIIFAQERILAGQFLIMVANEQGNARSGDLPRTPPTSQMRANLGGETCQKSGGFHQREAPREGHPPFERNGHGERKA